MAALLRTILLLSLCLAAGPAAAGDSAVPGPVAIERPLPQHLAPNRRLASPPAAGRWHEPGRRGEGIVYVFNEPIGELEPQIAPDPRLSLLCRNGLFKQAMPLRYRAVDGKGRIYGLAYGTGGPRANLEDPGGEARPDLVYLFDKQGTGRCAVWAGPLQAARALAGLTPAGRPAPGG